MKREGCSYDAFVDQMRKDDEFDAQLTAHGIHQAVSVADSLHVQNLSRSVELIVGSPCLLIELDLHLVASGRFPAFSCHPHRRPGPPSTALLLPAGKR